MPRHPPMCATGQPRHSSVPVREVGDMALLVVSKL
jgi:hypothetical protein